MRGAGFAGTTVRKTPGRQVRSTRILVAPSSKFKASSGNFNVPNHNAEKTKKNKKNKKKNQNPPTTNRSQRRLSCSRANASTLPGTPSSRRRGTRVTRTLPAERATTGERYLVGGGCPSRSISRIFHETVQTSTRYVLTFLARLYAGLTNARCCCCCVRTRPWTVRLPARAAAAPRTAVLNMEEALPRFIVVDVLCRCFRLSLDFFGNDKIRQSSTAEAINDCADHPSRNTLFLALSLGISLCLTRVVFSSFSLRSTSTSRHNWVQGKSEKWGRTCAGG